MAKPSVIPNLTEEQRKFIIEKYATEDLNLTDTVTKFSENYKDGSYPVKTICRTTVEKFLKREGIEIRKKGYTHDHKKHAYPTQRTPAITRKEITDEIRKDVMDDYRCLNKGIMAYKEIKNKVISVHGKYIDFEIFEHILREGGIDLDSREYREGRPCKNP